MTNRKELPMSDEHPTFKMSDDEMHYTARTRAGHLVVFALSSSAISTLGRSLALKQLIVHDH